MKYLPFLLCLIIIPVLLFSPITAFAQNPPAKKSPGLGSALTELGTVGEKAYGSKTAPKLPELVGKYIRIFLTLLGVIFVILMIYGGYSWMTAYGDKTKLDKAKDLIKDAVIGLIIVLAAYAISSFVVTQLIKQTIT